MWYPWLLWCEENILGVRASSIDALAPSTNFHWHDDGMKRIMWIPFLTSVLLLLFHAAEYRFYLKADAFQGLDAAGRHQTCANICSALISAFITWCYVSELPTMGEKRSTMSTQR